MQDKLHIKPHRKSVLSAGHQPGSRLFLAFLLFAGMALGSRAQEFLIQNINSVQETTGSTPAFFVPVGTNVFYFKANDGIHGTELWRSDGTADGTTLVADIATNSASADPASLVNVSGTLFFTATDSAHGRELWKSDGTFGGTTLVKDINPGATSSNPTNLVARGHLLLFSANGGTNSGTELWRSDGTVNGTVLVRDINPGPTSSNPSNLTLLSSNLVLFSASSGTTNGNELWKSDGTSIGTTLVKDIAPGALSSNPQTFVNVNGAIFFSAAVNSTNGIELWKSDGTTGGTFLVKDINPGPTSSSPQNLVNVNGTLFFSANSGTNFGGELWKSDGTTAGTILVKDINQGPASSTPLNLVNVGGTLFFTANAGSNSNFGVELWKSDGTATNTVLVKDIFPGAGSSSVANLVNVNGTLFFAANDGVNGSELWKSDGTDAGTVMVKDIRSGPLGSTPQNLANINGTLIFSADDGIVGRELWKSDGTEAGTEVILNIRDSDGDSNPANMVNLNGTLIFAASDGVNGLELWKSDGTPDGASLLKRINVVGTNGSSPANLVLVNGAVFFTADDGIHGQELWKTDGTETGTVLVKDINPAGSSSPANLMNFNGTLFFSANDGSNGLELWTSDGTGSGTVLFKDINPGSGSSTPANLVVAGTTLFFSASTPTNGVELWKSDGTVAGTVMVKDINPGFGASNPNNLAAFNNILFFAASGSTSNGFGNELWMSDGTDAGTVMVKDINPGFVSSNPQNLVVVSNLLFFSATGNSTNGTELWKSDGTAAGTVQVRDINPVPGGSSNPQSLINVNGTLFFSATGATNAGIELWKSDGTDAGTAMVKNINPFSANSSPANLFTVNGLLFFSATDGVNGRELWQSDGTAAGTFMVGDITDDSTDSNPGSLTVAGNTLFFAAQAPGIGRELFGIVLNHAPTVANSIPDHEVVFGWAFSFPIPPDTFADEDAGQTLTYAVSGLPPGISFVPETATLSGTFAAAGQFIVTVTATDNGGPIPLSATNTFVVTVNKAIPVLNWPAPADIVYGTALGGAQLNATANVPGTFDYSPAAGTVLAASSGEILFVTFTPDDIANYTFTNALVPISILQAPLTVAAADTSRTYAAANPSLTGTITGIQNGDAITATYDTTATATSPVGTYAITPTLVDPDGKLGNYTVSSSDGTLTVTPAALGVTANSAARVYGSANPAFTGIITGLVNGDLITATYAAAATPGSPVGTYAIVPTLIDPDGKLGNYALSSTNGTLTVTKAALAVSANNASRTYGAANPSFSGSITGLENGDNITATYATTATVASPVGSYSIVPTLADPSGKLGNYTVSSSSGTLNVTAAILSVSANDASRIYGTTNPPLTGSLTGVRNGDDITATYATTATVASPAGTYSIVPTLADPSGKLGNYGVSVGNGTLTITPAPLVVTITSPSSGFVESVDTNILFTGTFTKSGASDSYIAWWTFFNDNLPAFVVPSIVSNGTASAQVQFAAAGVYTFTLTVTNEFGPSAAATNVNADLPAYVVIYDPDGGFVTGGGWLSSPAGAYVLDPSLSGKATFGFVSKYQKGASIPTGQTQFNFQAGDLNFHSTSYEWLVISGAKAQYKGSGTINGAGDYAFMLTPVDGQVSGGGGVDKLRMKVWEKEHDILIYDNQRGASDSSLPITAIQAGSIVIHKE